MRREISERASKQTRKRKREREREFCMRAYACCVLLHKYEYICQTFKI